jgi:formate hydrogenlyase subunit 3/multisubunit Na+/H+ antiporter MnhD subunit
MIEYYVASMIAVPAAVGLISPILSRVSTKLRDGLCLLSLLFSASVAVYTIAFLNIASIERLAIFDFAWERVHFSLVLDRLNAVSVLFTNVWGALAIMYSIPYIRGYGHGGTYYALMLLAISAATATLLSSNYVPFFAFWILGTVLLFFLIRIAGPRAFYAAYKTLIIISVADLAMGIAILLLVMNVGSLEIGHLFNVSRQFTDLIFSLMLISALAKAGGMPLHTWIPDLAAEAPTSVTSYFPAAADKFLGIFKLTIICHILVSFGPTYSVVVAGIGAVTMLFATLTAIIQRDIKRILAFPVIGQVGYMIMGIGIGTPLGIAGGLFHMVNHCMYKMCLFQTSGAVQMRTGTKDLDRLGGLAKKMPVTFTCALIAALSISGIPPFNGFVSKWMIYQAALEVATRNPVYLVFAVVAAITSSFTLAHAIKYAGGVFLGSLPKEFEKVKEAPLSMKLSMLVLAAGCVFFGVFPAIPLQYIINPAVEMTLQKPLGDLHLISPFYGAYTTWGIWESPIATVLIVVTMMVGLIFLAISRRIQPPRAGVEGSSPFVGGEDSTFVYSGWQFYGTFKKMPFYRLCELGGFDAIWRTVAKPFRRLFKEPKYAVIAIYGIITVIFGLILYFGTR